MLALFPTFLTLFPLFSILPSVLCIPQAIPQASRIYANPVGPPGSVVTPYTSPPNADSLTGSGQSHLYPCAGPVAAVCGPGGHNSIITDPERVSQLPPAAHGSPAAAPHPPS